MTKARAGYHGPMGLGLSQFFNGIGGPEYMYSILTGYRDASNTVSGPIPVRPFVIWSQIPV